MLLEREAELAAVARLLEAATDSRGALAVVEGPPGIGKTSLLAAAVDLAGAGRIVVHRAAGHELESAFAWGVARQLFERSLAALDDDGRARVGTGAAATASQVLLGTPAGADAAPFAVLHSLYWLCANLSADAPRLLIVDDAQWADEQTLRLLAYLAARLEELPVAVLVGMRPPDRGTAVLRALARDPRALRLRPEPLTAGAVAAQLATRLGAPPDAEFAAACYGSTGGNPFLLDALAQALADAGVEPTAEAAQHAQKLGSRALLDTVVHQMLRLPDDAQRLAHAVAVLDSDSEAHLAGAVSGLSAEVAAAVTDALVAEHVLAAERPLRFVHPLVRTAVAATIAPGERELRHARAAALLRDAGAPPERVAGHLLRAAPGVHPWAATVLREAGRAAAAGGAPDAAVRYLRRALEEPGAQRGELLGALGLVELRLGLEVGERHLRQAMRLAPDGRAYAALVLGLRRPLFVQNRHAEAAALFADALARLDGADPELALELEAARVLAMRFGDAGPADVSAAGVRGTSVGERKLLAVTAFERAMDGGTAAEIAALAARAAGLGEQWRQAGGRALAAAFAAGRGIVADGEDDLPAALLADALAYAGHLDAAAALAQAGLQRAQRAGRRSSVVMFSVPAALAAYRRGALADAGADAERAVAGASELGLEVVGAYARELLAEILLDRGHSDAARALLVPEPSLPRARLRLADGDHAGARADLEALLTTAWGTSNPGLRPLRSTLALATEERDAALAHARTELADAERWGAPAAIGAAQRVLGLLEGDEIRLATAVATLHGSGAALELARAEVELGAAIRRAGRRTEAKPLLAEGLDLAARCGAEPLAQRAREELLAAGARPRRSALSGVDALTPSELRVARLAAEGRTNREIAQALFVTLRTVEVHLTRVYQKLSLENRTQLADALAAAVPQSVRPTG